MYDSKGKPDYDKMRLQDEFQIAIDELAELASQRRTVILCSEGDPKQCHRRLLLGPPLEAAGFEDSARHARRECHFRDRGLEVSRAG